MAGWNADTAAGSVGAGAITLVEGSSFCISQANGDITRGPAHGVFIQDTRVLSQWELRINGQALESLAAEVREPYRALFIARVPGAENHADSGLLVERLREVSGGLQERITLRNYSMESAAFEVCLRIDADFSDLFEVKEARIRQRWTISRELSEDSLVISAAWNELSRAVVVQGAGAEVTNEGLIYRLNLEAHAVWTVIITALPAAPWGSGSGTLSDFGGATASRLDARRKEWVAKIPVIHAGNRSIERTLRRSYDDLGALRIEDPNHPDRVVVAAGAPWFMTLFGRDSLWASRMSLDVDPSLALGTLQTLADRQGRVVDPVTEEEPGKILHEVRLDVSTSLALGGKSVYFGSVDSTPLFVMVLGAVSRWGFATDTIAELLPHADRALDWIRHYGDKDGDGFVEYQRLSSQGLLNQGWKDSWDGINFADGRLAQPPIALCEVQAYVYTALLTRSWMAYDAGDPALGANLAREAASLKVKFNEQFWVRDRGYFAIALDGKKRQVDSCASNMGQCLWHGIIDDDKVPQVVEWLMSKELFSGWGVRTLATNMAAYNPASYHNGSVWPHDNAIIVAGLMRYGYVDEAQRIATALLDAAEFSGGRLPELFCGFEREKLVAPVPYPTACSPQAWAATTPIQLLTSMMGYDAYVSRGGVWMDPAVPESFGDLHISNAPIADGRITIDVSGTEATVGGLPDGLTYHQGHRPWFADLVNEMAHRTLPKGPDIL